MQILILTLNQNFNINSYSVFRYKQRCEKQKSPTKEAFLCVDKISFDVIFLITQKLGRLLLFHWLLRKH